jgi:hypothetical protein
LLAIFLKKINIIHKIPYHMNFQQVKNKLKIQFIKKYPRKPKYDPKKVSVWIPNGFQMETQGVFCPLIMK